jgi:hypothetical protein
MKNIHILPTTEKSRLHHYYSFTPQYALSKEPLNWRTASHIYITSDKEIKRNDYYIHNNRVGQSAGGELVKGDYKNCKKIILTTDPTLISDGVQAIDDEFLEWFVKNPTCEFVDVKYFDNDCYGECGICDNSCGSYYKIIIPQEESKQSKVFSENGNQLIFDKKGGLIKEASEKCVLDNSDMRATHSMGEFAEFTFKEGVGWHAEKILEFLYSEITERRDYSASKMCEKVIEFIEQFKNKKP